MLVWPDILSSAFLLATTDLYKISHIDYRGTYGTAQFKLDIFTRVLVESLERFGMKLASCARAHNSSGAIRSSRRVIRS